MGISMAKILVVDDMEEMTEIIHYFLEEDGHEVVSVNSSHEAVILLEKEEYQILITDLLMPEIDGFELIQDLKDSNEGDHVPKIIAISGGVAGLGTETILNAASLKADAIVKKPFTREDISSTVEKLLAA